MNVQATPAVTKDSGPKSLLGRAYRKVKRVVRQRKRQALRRRIAFTPPSPAADSNVRFSPHCLTCHQDLLLAVCSAKSLNLALQKALPWVFHDDGSLTTADQQFLQLQFPGCQVVERGAADDYFKASQFDCIVKARKRSVLLLKLADVHVFAKRDRILFVDSDVLFFKKPEALFRVLESENRSYFSKDIQTAYVEDLATLQNFTGVKPLERVNSGIFAVNRSDISLEKITSKLLGLEKLKCQNEVLYNHLIEQTLFAILTTDSPQGVSHLPSEYDLSLERGLNGAVCRHYVGVIREYFELEGLRALLNEQDFISQWNAFCRKAASNKPALTP